ncbi:HEAT repeat-containing protein [Singulisphaera sp. GP187]|uniref:HEAT repeat domain-containing protein n=1 Tax=Singulisphaera sp. GP187 TaxID=1882752 RepID=UPI000926FFF4|nr:HEAT repeat domain-containing protein [Singulisphaera sp. GP187]SIO43394.1 HEAT repeat-containing protein [Singulisphaera sp. GP187]
MLGNLACWVAVVLGADAGRLPNLEAEAHAGRPASVEIPAAPVSRTLSVSISLTQPGRLAPAAPIAVTLAFGETTLNKTLHLGDPDIVWTILQPKQTPARVTIEASEPHKAPVPFAVRVADLGEPAEDGVSFEAEPNDRPEQANPLVLGQTVHGLADDRPYFPLGEQPTEAENAVGPDWFTFTFSSDTPQLAFFALDFIDRDVPPDVRVYQLKEGKPVEYTVGIDPQSLQREKPPRPGANKFTTRLLTRGTYYVMVDACQPDYRLRTKLFDVPPYLDKKDAGDPEKVAESARRAIKTALDFQLLAGDSWHANTPRKGHPMDRVANAHHETSTCIACHPTHFTTQSAMGAVRSGYKIEQPFALRFLLDRLSNNPVPFHGHPEALWARMIPAPANVLGRLSTIVMDSENLIAGPPRDNTHRGISEFLKLYYDDRKELPPDESNGNNPVSRYKVATDSWRQLDEIVRRTGDARFAKTRDLVATFLPTGEPANTRDLAAQTIGLCLVDPAKFADKIKANVDRLLSLQRDNGHWSVKFDPTYAITEMQTGESLYALSLAGLPADHPAVRKGVVALLLRQKNFGGWLDISPYEQFQTPFRETQWALLALSRIYPGHGTKGWNGPLGPQPATLRVDSSSRLLRDLERIWESPTLAVREALITQLGDERPLVRLAACETLGRVGDESALAGLVARLGDESKAVQRAAAEALRSIGNRLNANQRPGETPAQTRFVSVLKQALGSADDRTRRGATRIFAAHFRDLSQELSLADALLERLDDSDPVVQLQAIKGAWRWWYWQADSALRNRIEDQLIARLSTPRHPWVRRNLIEALYIIGDENIRYLYTNWVPALATHERRDIATEAQHATSNRLGDKYVAVLDHGNALQRDGVLRAISEFHERPVLGGRIGNDLEPLLVYGDAQARVSTALIGQMADPAPTIRRLALQALVALRDDRDPTLALAVTARQGDVDPSVREWAGTMAEKFPLKVKMGHADAPLVALLDDLLKNQTPQAQSAALAILSRLGPVAEADRSGAVVARLDDKAPTVRAAALKALPAFPKLLADRAVRSQVAEALTDADVDARVSAIRLVLGAKVKVSDSALRKALEDPAPEHRIGLLNSVSPKTADVSDLRLIGVISNGVVDENSGVREKALQVIQAHPKLVANPAIEASLRELTGTDNQRQKEIASALLKSGGRSSGAGASADLLDLAYFEAKVLPIFTAVGEDGQSCMGCHRSHTILKMVAPGKDGKWSPQAVRANFRAALRVVDLPSPADSLLLGKPTWEAAEEAEAQNDPTKKAHSGGVRFEAKRSAEYQTLLDWINGARLKPAGGVPAASR